MPASEGAESLAETLDTNTEADAAAVEAVASEESGQTPENSTGAGQTTQQTEPEWRAPLNEIASGLSAEMRQQLEEMRREIRAAREYQRQQSQARKEPEKDPYDDLRTWLEKKGDPDFYNHLQRKFKEPMERIEKLEQQISEQRRQAAVADRTQKIFQHIETNAQAAAKEAKIPEKLQEMFARFLVVDIQSGNNGKAHDPFRYDFRTAAKKFYSTIEDYVDARKKEQVQAAEAQKGKPPTTGSGAATKPGGKEKVGDFSELHAIVNEHFQPK